ncbi:energy-converting hydrogenase Eha subunit A [Neobacillus sp. B4I6]|uniref:hypothetical protein n=1 Tax=Neobacillus sp. B4I6 TaxID=3373925 RepID=UPI003D1EC8F1
MIGALSLVAGVVCIVISIMLFIPNLKKAKSVKEKWEVFFEFLIDPFGLTSLFYLGLLLILYGLLKLSNLL